MERYEACTSLQKEILDRLYEYLGFNEITSFGNFIVFMFKNAKQPITFEHIINHSIKHIVISFWKSFPQYSKGNYIKYLWLSEKNMLNHFSPGSPTEFDPKGLVRLFVKDNFNSLLESKL